MNNQGYIDDSGKSQNGLHHRNQNGSVKGSEAATYDDTVSEGTAGGLHLKQQVGLTGGISIIMGTIIGSGIFISSKGVSEGAGSVALSIILWILCGLISMCGALSMVELGTLIPESGGEHAYFMASFGRGLAFLFDWTFLLMLKPSSLAIVTMTCAEYLTVPFFDDDCGGPPDSIIKILAVTVVLLLVAINCSSVPLATTIQVTFTIIKVIALIIIILGGIVRIIQGYTDNFTGFDNTNDSIGQIVLGMYSGMWAYNGWNNLNYVTEELVNSEKNLPRSIWIGMPTVILLYVLVNISYFTVMSVDELIDSPAIAITWAEEVMGNIWWLMPIFVACSTFGSGNGNLFTTGRIAFVAARDGHMMSILSYIHVENITPVPSVIFIGLIGIIYIIPSDVQGLIDTFNYTTWFFYGCGMAALLMMRYTKRDEPRPYKVNISLPIITLISAIILVLVPLIDEPQPGFLFATLFVLAGLIFYFPIVHYGKIPGCMPAFTTKLQLWMKVSPTIRQEVEEEEVVPVEEEIDKRSIE